MPSVERILSAAGTGEGVQSFLRSLCHAETHSMPMQGIAMPLRLFSCSALYELAFSVASQEKRKPDSQECEVMPCSKPRRPYAFRQYPLPVGPPALTAASQRNRVQLWAALTKRVAVIGRTSHSATTHASQLEGNSHVLGRTQPRTVAGRDSVYWSSIDGCSKDDLPLWRPEDW